MDPAETVKLMEERIRAFNDLQDLVKSLKWIEEELGQGSPMRAWQIAKVYENGSGSIWSRTVPDAVFISLIGPGLRVVLPVFEEMLANFKIWPAE